MKNLQLLANELATDKMTLLVTNDMLNIKGGGGSKGGSRRSQKRSLRKNLTKVVTAAVSNS